MHPFLSSRSSVFSQLVSLANSQGVSGVLLQIYWMGKPDPVIYDVALDMWDLPKECVLAIGDSLQHDIQGTACDTTASTVSAPPIVHNRRLFS